MGQHDIVGRLAARAATFEQRGMEPAAMLIGTFEIHDSILAAVAFAAKPFEAWKRDRVFDREGVRRA